MHLAPKRLHPWCCEALLRFLALARVEILQDFLVDVQVVQVDKNKAAADEAVKQQSFVSMASGVQFGWAHKFPLDRATLFC